MLPIRGNHPHHPETQNVPPYPPPKIYQTPYALPLPLCVLHHNIDLSDQWRVQGDSGGSLWTKIISFSWRIFRKKKLSGKVNKSPTPLWKFEPLSRNPGTALADLPSRHASLTHYRINIDSTPYIESMLNQGYVPAWWSPVYNQKVNRKWDNRENITVYRGFAAYIRHKPIKRVIQRLYCCMFSQNRQV